MDEYFFHLVQFCVLFSIFNYFIEFTFHFHRYRLPNAILSIVFFFAQYLLSLMGTLI